MEEKSSMPGAGFLIFREDTLSSGSPLMLALVRSDGQLDIPKGRIDDGESSIDAAKRECFEECSIVINEGDILFSKQVHNNGDLNVYCAKTNKTPMITKNPHSGIKEHESYRWLSKEDFCADCLHYLTPAINHFYSSYAQAYNNT